MKESKEVTVLLALHAICAAAFAPATSSVFARRVQSCLESGPFMPRIAFGVGAPRRLDALRMATPQRGDGERERINERMATEFERVTKALGMSRDDPLDQPSTDAAGSGLNFQSHFTPSELATLQELVGESSPALDSNSHAEHERVAGSTIAAGGETYSVVGHSAAVTGDGRLFMWGSGSDGRLGRECGDSENSPIEVGGLLGEVRRQGVRVRGVSCGYDHSACVTEDGRVFVWGSGSRGQLGLGSASLQLLPAQVEGVLAEKQASLVSCGRCHTAVITTDGLLFTFGQGDDGQLGNGADKDSYEPVQVTGELAGQRVVDVSCGGEITAALTHAGELFTWGSGIFGQLGHDSTENEYRPRSLSGVPELRLPHARSRTVASVSARTPFLCRDLLTPILEMFLIPVRALVLVSGRLVMIWFSVHAFPT
jgi:hypothetical protein